MKVNHNADFFPVAPKSNVGPSQKNQAVSFSDCMKESAFHVSHKKKMNDTPKNQTKKSDYKKDAYPDSYSRVKEAKTKEPGDVKELSKEDLKQMSDEMKENIMDTLSVSDDELEDIMAALNLSWVDLLNPQKLKSLVLACEGKGQVDLLTDENLNQSLQTVLNEFKELIAEHGTDISLVESSLKGLQNGNFSEELEDSVQDALWEPIEEIQENQEQTEHTKQTEALLSQSETQETNDDFTVAAASSKEEKSFQKKGKEGQEFDNSNSFKEQFTTIVEQNVKETITTVKKEDGNSIVSQIVTQIKVMVSKDSSSIQMQLYPEHLGKLSIQVSEKSGAMTAQLVVESEEAKQALLSSMNELKDAFQEQNLRIAEIEVSVAPKGFEQQEESSKDHSSSDSKKSGKSGMKTIRLDEFLEEETMELLEEDKIAVELMQANGSSVNFTA